MFMFCILSKSYLQKVFSCAESGNQQYPHHFHPPLVALRGLHNGILDPSLSFTKVTKILRAISRRTSGLSLAACQRRAHPPLRYNNCGGSIAMSTNYASISPDGQPGLRTYIDGKSDGPTIVFVHGWPDDHALWDKQVRTN